MVATTSLTEGGRIEEALAGKVLEADLRLYRAVRGRATHPVPVRAAAALSHFGEHALGWLALGAAGAAIGPRRREWAAGTAAVAAAHALNVLVKRRVRRQRPVLADLPALARTPSTLSFPSAHAASTFAAAAAFSPLAPRLPLYPVAGAMAVSRVFLGVHYPTDVLAGAALGTAVGRLSTAAARRLHPG